MRKIITGPTGCGKTYQAINRARAMGRFAYATPCRLLAYETFIKYAGPNDRLETGAAKVILGQGSLFTCFSGIRPKNIRQGRYQAIIIDEAHWIDGHGKAQERQIKKIIKACLETGTPIMLLTGTLDFMIDGFEVEHLEPIEEFNIQRVPFDDAVARMEAGAKTLVIASSISDSEYWADRLSSPVINRNMPEYDIFRLMIEFNEGRINCLVATNIAAQGLNLPCENLILDLNNFDGNQDVAQKIGRLGRPFMGKENQVLTVYYNRDVDDDDPFSGGQPEDYEDDYVAACSGTERAIHRWSRWDNLTQQKRMEEYPCYYAVDLDKIPEPEDDYQEPGRDRDCEILIYRQLKKRWYDEAMKMNVAFNQKPQSAPAPIPACVLAMLDDEDDDEDMGEFDKFQRCVDRGEKYHPRFY